MIELINTGIMGGIFITGIYWVIRSIRKDRRDNFNNNDTTVSI